MNIQTLIKTYANSFITEARDNGDQYIKTKPDTPPSVKSLLLECHDNGKTLPSDFIYKKVSEMLNELDNAEIEGVEDIDEALEIETDIHTNDLLRWFNEADFMFYCDRATEEQPYTSIIELMQGGQHHHLYELKQCIINHFEEQTA